MAIAAAAVIAQTWLQLRLQLCTRAVPGAPVGTLACLTAGLSGDFLC